MLSPEEYNKGIGNLPLLVLRLTMLNNDLLCLACSTTISNEELQAKLEHAMATADAYWQSYWDSGD